MKMKTTLLAVLLALAAALNLAGCAFGDTSWAYEKDGGRMPAGLYISYQISAYEDAYQLLSEENAGQEGFVAPQTVKELLNTQVGGKNAGQWIQEKTLQYVKLYYYAETRFTEMGLEEDSNIQVYADYVTESMWAQNGKIYEQNGIAKSSLSARSVNDIKQQLIFDKLYGEGGEREVPLEQLQQAFRQDYLLMDTITGGKPTGVPEGSTKTIEEYEAEVKALLEGYVPRLGAGEKLVDLAAEFQNQMITLFGEGTGEVTAPAEDELRLFIPKSDRTYYESALPDFMSAVGAAAFGAIEVVDAGDAFILIRKYDPVAEGDYFEGYRTTVLADMKYEEFEAELLAAAASVEVKQNGAAVNRYKMENLKLS